jgi:hypothetical protein
MQWVQTFANKIMYCHILNNIRQRTDKEKKSTVIEQLKTLMFLKFKVLNRNTKNLFFFLPNFYFTVLHVNLLQNNIFIIMIQYNVGFITHILLMQ